MYARLVNVVVFALGVERLDPSLLLHRVLWGSCVGMMVRTMSELSGAWWYMMANSSCGSTGACEVIGSGCTESEIAAVAEVALQVVMWWWLWLCVEE